MDFHWNGDQLAEEIPVGVDGKLEDENAIGWIYEPGSFTPLARYEKGQLHYAVTDITGRIQELLTEDGTIVWKGKQQLWGREEGINNEDAPTCRLRFPGQYEDDESGLFYNRYRYYDGDTGQYVSPDPIGLLGGDNPYGYVINPLKYIDPLGLVGVDTLGYNVYGLYDPGATKPYYVGITDNIDRRAIEHTRSGRLTPGASMQPLDRNVTYGEARGYEQHYIEEFGTKTGVRGEPVSATNR